MQSVFGIGPCVKWVDKIKNNATMNTKFQLVVQRHKNLQKLSLYVLCVQEITK